MTHRRTHSPARPVFAVVVLVALGATVAGPAHGAIRARRVARNLNGPAAFTLTHKGTIVYLERGTGEVRFRNPRTGFDRRFFDIAGVDGSGERGRSASPCTPDGRRSPSSTST